MRFLTAVALVMLWVPVDGVAQEYSPLKDLNTLDQTLVVGWGGIENGAQSEANFTAKASNAFELRLLRMGLNLSDTGMINLACTIKMYPSDTLVAFSVEVDIRQIVAPWHPARDFSWDDRIVASTWHRSVPGAVGLGALDGAQLGEVCADLFELPWRRANN